MLQVLKEEIRKYKARVQATERQASEQEHKVQALQEQNCKLKAALQVQSLLVVSLCSSQSWSF